MSSKLPFGISLLTLAIVSSPAISSTEGLEIIEVYAQKRKQSANDVAISLSQLKPDMIVNSGIKDTTELGALSTNVKISQNAAEGTPPAISIRGVGLVDYNTANTSPVATYIDGVSVGSANNQIVNLFDIAQVDVLKGPQGTLFGRNSTGGAILIRTQRPDHGNYGFLKVGLGSDKLKKATGVYNQIINDESAVRIAFNHSNYDYTTYNLAEGFPEAGMEQNDVRLSYLGEWDDFSAFVKLDYGHWSGLVQPVGSIGIFSDPVSQTLCSPQEAGSNACFDAVGFNDGSEDFFALKVNNTQRHHTTSKGITTELVWSGDNEDSITLASAFHTLERTHGFNCDGSTWNLCEGQLGVDSERLNTELRYQRALDQGYLTLGLYYFSESLKQNNFNDLFRDFRGKEFAGVPITFIYDNDIDTDSTALFGQYEHQLSDNLTLITGLRYAKEKVDYISKTDFNVVYDTSDLAGTTLPLYTVSGEESDNRFSGKVALNYKLSKNNSAYYSFSNGTKSGGYNGGYLSSEEQAKNAAYGPEKLNAHEIGAKFLLQDNTLRLNVATFYYDYKDQQVFMNQASESPNSPPYQLLENVANSTIYGAELEFEKAWSDEWTVGGGVGYVPEANFDEFVDPLGNVLTDNRLPFSSERNIFGYATHQTELSKIEIKSSIRFDYQSEFYFDQNESAYASQASHTLWYADVQFKYGNLQMGLWGKNLFDKEYSHLKFDLSQFLGMLEDFKGEGRRVGVDVTYLF